MSLPNEIVVTFWQDRSVARSLPVDFDISAAYVARVLDQAATFRGDPAAARTDNGPEFTSRAFMPGRPVMASATL